MATDSKTKYCTEHMLYRTVIFDHNYHWLLASKLLCIWFLILHARIQSLKESQEVPEELFSSELIETIAHNFYPNIGVTYKKTTAAKDNFR